VLDNHTLDKITTIVTLEDAMVHHDNLLATQTLKKKKKKKFKQIDAIIK
jgi:hypothetical protein